MTGPESRGTRGKLHCCYHLAVTSNKIEERNAKEGPCHAPSSPTPNPAQNGIQSNASPDFRQLYYTSRIINCSCGTHFTQYYLISITSLLMSISIGPVTHYYVLLLSISVGPSFINMDFVAVQIQGGKIMFFFFHFSSKKFWRKFFNNLQLRLGHAGLEFFPLSYMQFILSGEKITTMPQISIFTKLKRKKN